MRNDVLRRGLLIGSFLLLGFGSAYAASLLDGGDPFFVLADFRAYCDEQQLCERLYKQPRVWAQKALLNTARLGYFSSDRTIREYVRDIWG